MTLELTRHMCIDLWTVEKYQSQQNIFDISNVRTWYEFKFNIEMARTSFLDGLVVRVIQQNTKYYMSVLVSHHSLLSQKTKGFL